MVHLLQMQPLERTLGGRRASTKCLPDACALSSPTSRALCPPEARSRPGQERTIGDLLALLTQGPQQGSGAVQGEQRVRPAPAESHHSADTEGQLAALPPVEHTVEHKVGWQVQQGAHDRHAPAGRLPLSHANSTADDPAGKQGGDRGGGTRSTQGRDDLALQCRPRLHSTPSGRSSTQLSFTHPHPLRQI